MQSRCVCFREEPHSQLEKLVSTRRLLGSEPSCTVGGVRAKLSLGVRHLGMVLDLVRMASLLISSSTVLSKLFSYLKWGNNRTNFGGLLRGSHEANTHRIVPKAEILAVYVLFLNKGR